MKKVLLTLLLLSSVASVFASEKPNYENELETRLAVTVKKSFLNKTLNVEFSPEVRFAKPLDHDKTLLNLAVDYDVLNWFNVGVGYRATFNKTKKRGTEITGRYDLNISKSIKVGKFRIKPRIRFCDYQEFANTKEGEESSSYLRYKLGVGYKYSKKAIFEPTISAELYHDLASGYINSIRYSVGGDFRITKNNSIGLAYLIQTEFKTRNLINIVKIGYTYKF